MGFKRSPPSLPTRFFFHAYISVPFFYADRTPKSHRRYHGIPSNGPNAVLPVKTTRPNFLSDLMYLRKKKHKSIPLETAFNVTLLRADE